MAPARSIVAAAAARAEPDVAIIFMGDFLLRMNLNVNATRARRPSAPASSKVRPRPEGSFSLEMILLANRAYNAKSWSAR